MQQPLLLSARYTVYAAIYLVACGLLMLNPVPVTMTIASQLWIPIGIGMLTAFYAYRQSQTQIVVICAMLLLYLIVGYLFPLLTFKPVYREMVPLCIALSAVVLVYRTTKQLTKHTALELMGTLSVVWVMMFMAVAVDYSYPVTQGQALRYGQVALLVLIGAVALMLLALYQDPDPKIAALMAVVLGIGGAVYYIGTLNNYLLITLFIGGLFLVVNQEGHTMMFTDKLTGLKGRRALDADSTGLGSKYIVCMGDVDKFKSFNDTYGHDVGDDVLRLVAMRIASVGGGGKPYRYGGEEFSVLFPHDDMEEAKEAIEKVRKKIASKPFVIRNESARADASEEDRSSAKQGIEEVKVTMSFGLSKRKAEENFDEAMIRADEALYMAKQNGRNRTELSQHE